MDRADGIGVVGLIGMRRHRVGERRVDGRGHDAGADHHRLGLAAEAVDIACGELAGLEARAGHDRGERVEHMQLGAGDDVGRQFAIERVRNVFGKRVGCRGDGGRITPVRGVARRGGRSLRLRHGDRNSAG